MTRLFANEVLHSWLSERASEATREVESLSPEVVRTNAAAAANSIVDKFSVSNLKVDWSNYWGDEVEETTVTSRDFGRVVWLKAFLLRIHVPYIGDKRLFNMQASMRYLSGNVEANVEESEINFEIRTTRADLEEFNTEINFLRSAVVQQVDWLNNDLVNWRAQLRQAVDSRISGRVAHLGVAASLTSKLNIPLRRKAQDTIDIPVNRKAIRPIAQRADPESNPDPDPTIAASIYVDVLRTIRSVGNSFERLPQTATRFHEEELRDLLLFILNSNYEGNAAGEVFNGQGKTDILIRFRDRNAFIGECKVWHGQKAFGEAIDQLLSYTVWRDTKAALILFIKEGAATDIIEKAEAAIQDHQGFDRVRDATQENATRQFIMHALDDERRSIEVALLPIVIRTRPEVDTAT